MPGLSPGIGSVKPGARGGGGPSPRSAMRRQPPPKLRLAPTPRLPGQRQVDSSPRGDMSQDIVGRQAITHWIYAAKIVAIPRRRGAGVIAPRRIGTENRIANQKVERAPAVT